jgi:hypothetical protein
VLAVDDRAAHGVLDQGRQVVGGQAERVQERAQRDFDAAVGMGDAGAAAAALVGCVEPGSQGGHRAWGEGWHGDGGDVGRGGAGAEAVVDGLPQRGEFRVGGEDGAVGGHGVSWG